ncbi:hypothetical protein D3C76_1803020 [compost metagenome]
MVAGPHPQPVKLTRPQHGGVVQFAEAALLARKPDCVLVRRPRRGPDQQIPDRRGRRITKRS